MQNLTRILGIVLIERTEKRVIANYNENGSLKEFKTQREFEQMAVKVLNANYDTETEEVAMFLLTNKLVMAKTYSDFFVIVFSENSENEMVLYQLLDILTITMFSFFQKDLNLKGVYSHYQEVVLMLNESFSNGLILTLTHEDLLARVILSKHRKGKAVTASSSKGGVMGFLGFS